MNFTELIYKELSYEITGVLFSVHNELGRYCNEKQYSDAIEFKLLSKGLKVNKEFVLPSTVTTERFPRNRVDFLIEDKIILEIKAKRFINSEDYYQVRRYLEAINKKLGLLANFRDKYLKPKRILNSNCKLN